MKNYKEFISENISERSKFKLDKFNMYVKEENFTDMDYLYRTYNKIYDKDVLVVAKNVYSSNTLTINERRQIDYYLYLTNQKFEDVFNDYYNNGGMIQEEYFGSGLVSGVVNVLSKGVDWIEKGALKTAKSIGDAAKNGFEKLLKSVKTVLEFGEKIYKQFLEGFVGVISKVEEHSSNLFGVIKPDDSKMTQFSDAMIEYIAEESDKLPDYFERLINGGKSLAILFTNLSKKIALKLKEFFTNLFSKEKITDSYSYESFISYQMNEGLTGNFFDNITEFIKTTRPFSWLIELGKYLENLTGKIILKIKSKIVDFIKDISDVDMAKGAGFVKKKNESSYDDDFLFEGFSSSFAVSASRPLSLAIDMMQIYSMIYIKGINNSTGEWADLAKNILTGNLVAAAEEGFKKITQGALTVAKTAFNVTFPWVMPVVKGISLFFTLYGLWNKIKPIIIAAKDKIKAKITGATTSTPGATASTPGATASTPTGATASTPSQ